MADLLSDLESMVANIKTSIDHDVQEQDVQRWQRLFRQSHAHTKHEIETWRKEIDRLHVPDELWELVREEKESEGHDRESYEYAMWLSKSGRTRARSIKATPTSANTSYIFKLEEPLASLEKVQAIAQLAVPPRIAVGIGEFGDAQFCIIDSSVHQTILEWIAASHPTFRPTIVRLSQSPKDLNDDSMAPTLGLDTTLPQNRASNTDVKPEPTQNQYPVWYFFYGNLAKADELQQRLGLPELPTYIPARVRRGRIRSWRGKYRALVDRDACADAATDGSSQGEQGSAYLVTSREHEDILRFYETEKYEVVRCDIEMDQRTQKGLVFRFAGTEDELE